jgi:hypothetical protein
VEQQKPKRKHRATGGPMGGARPGAGRPAGSRNVLPKGTVKLVAGLRHRVPPGTPEPLAELADETLETLARVMRKPKRGDFIRLQAATAIRADICGPPTQKVEHGGLKMVLVSDPYAVPAVGAPDARTVPPATAADRGEG